MLVGCRDFLALRLYSGALLLGACVMLITVSRMSAGFVAILVGYTSSAAIILQATEGVGASSEEVISWFWALGIGMGVTCIGLSLRFKDPIVTAWSTPGAALLATGLSGLSLAEAIGVFLFSSVLIFLTGVTGLFDRIMRMVPSSIAAAMLAGILLKFGMNVFVAFEHQPLLVGVMLLVYAIVRPMTAKFVVPCTLVAGFLLSYFLGQTKFDDVIWSISAPIFTLPEFNVSALIGVGIPLFVVTMTSQNMPGFAIMRANGFHTPASPIITWTGATGIILAPFGGFAFNLAAITAAICMSKDADPNPKTRYLVAVWAGIFYLLAGIFAATMVTLFTALPQALILTIAGLALLGVIGNSLVGALSDESNRDAAVITFLVSASGIEILGIASAFWGLIFGAAYLFLSKIVKSSRLGKSL